MSESMKSRSPMQVELGEGTPLLRNDQTPPSESKRCFPIPGLVATVVVVLLGSLLAYGLIKRHEVHPVPWKILHPPGSDAPEPIPAPTLFDPFSKVDPRSLSFSGARRPFNLPGPVFGSLRHMNLPLPTNSWSQNLLYGNVLDGPNNRVVQIPYVIDTAGMVPGIRTHGSIVQANSVMVITVFEPDDGVTLSAVEPVNKTQEVVPYPAFGRLALTLQWRKNLAGANSSRESPHPRMRSPIVRGSPYSTMEYTNLTPRLVVQRSLSAPIVIDNDYSEQSPKLECGIGRGVFSDTPVFVNRELRLQFDTSDMTWLVFVSRPTSFVCSNTPMPLPDPNAPALPPGVLPVYGNGSAPTAYFELKATAPMYPAGVVRIALVNNCTTGQSPTHCDMKTSRNQSAYESLIRNNAEIYPSGEANIEFAFPSDDLELENTIIHFDWAPVTMSSGNEPRSDIDSNTPNGNVGKNNSKNSDITRRRLSDSSAQLMMLALPHQQTSLKSLNDSKNVILDIGCTFTLQGNACPVLGNRWNLVEEVREVQFGALQPYRIEMMADIRTALASDLNYRIPINYMRGAGDTYFSGKMLAKLARIILIGAEVANITRAHDSAIYSDWLSQYEFQHRAALEHLKAGVEIWLNGSALAPLVYDDSWGGMVGCGCNFNSEYNTCNNFFPDCPALVDPGQNYGSGFYNDHHFHYGYHIYAAAVVTKLDHKWGRDFHEHVLCLIRDIANPSESDPFFPMWRHKDWYLGSSWASGIVNFQGNPYPNGRNQESSSEAINAYEAVALYGLATKEAFSEKGNTEHVRHQMTAENIHSMGKLLLATEIRSAQVYYHVQSRSNASGVRRIYPDVYAPKIVGMLWSFLAQQQTWFGAQPWASYGIQLMPITPVAQYRDTVPWVQEMLPIFNNSCASDPICEAQGWSILVLACQATLGEWKAAWRGIQNLPDVVFETAGGNGHSRSNSLWWIATRP